jgi:hypothetical protein
LSWGPNRSGFVRTAVIVLLASAATAVSADILVVRSAGPSAKSFPPGRSLPEAGKVTLKANDTVVVLDARGTRTLRGPGIFSPGGPAQTASRADITRLTGTAPRRARIGAVRGVGGTNDRNPSIWHVDIAKSSTVCLADRGNVQLWRSDSARPARLTISGSGGRSQNIELPAGVATATWPSQLPLADGATYQVSWAGAGKPTILKFKTLPANPGGLEDMASSLIQNNCQAQLDRLIETVRLPDDRPPTG